MLGKKTERISIQFCFVVDMRRVSVDRPLQLLQDICVDIDNRIFLGIVQTQFQWNFPQNGQETFAFVCN